MQRYRTCKSIVFTLTLSLASIFTLTGCGKQDQELDRYQEEMTAFAENILTLDTQMNGIDPNTETAVEDLLVSLDSIDAAFQLLATIEVPEEFLAIEDLADEAGSYMTDAVKLYHQVFNNESYDEYNALLAKENYNRAMKRLGYISTILQGEIPEGDDITVIQGDEENATDENVTDENQIEE